MNNETKTDSTVTSDEIEAIATDFEGREFTPDELANLKRTRRRSPRIGETRAEVYTFRAPHSYKSRIKQRASTDETTESQVIRDALDSYL
ncbi:MAG: hypothetical protein OXB90_03170 [Acidimicrobiaceae bacterium]|nr:hypothetical protein [Acidimicrobiaceae bacterium]